MEEPPAKSRRERPCGSMKERKAKKAAEAEGVDLKALRSQLEEKVSRQDEKKRRRKAKKLEKKLKKKVKKLKKAKGSAKSSKAITSSSSSSTEVSSGSSTDSSTDPSWDPRNMSRLRRKKRHQLASNKQLLLEMKASEGILKQAKKGNKITPEEAHTEVPKEEAKPVLQKGLCREQSQWRGSG